MFADFGDIIESCSLSFDVLRAPKGIDVKGRVVKSPRSAFACSGSVQRPRSIDVERLRELKRNEEAISIYTTAKLSVGDGEFEADHICFEGQTFEVVSRKPWAQMANYNRYIASKVGQ